MQLDIDRQERVVMNEASEQMVSKITSLEQENDLIQQSLIYKDEEIGELTREIQNKQK